MNQHILTTIRCDDQYPVNESIITDLLVIEHDHPVLVHKTGGGEARRFWPTGGMLIRREHLFEGRR